MIQAKRHGSGLRKLLSHHSSAVTVASQERENLQDSEFQMTQPSMCRGSSVSGGSEQTGEQWSGEAKIAVMPDSASLNIEQLNEHRHRKGLCPNSSNSGNRRVSRAKMFCRKRIASEALQRLYRIY